MALIKCPECGKENVSDSAEVCPNCGYGIKKHFKNKNIETGYSIKDVISLVIIAALTLFIILFFIARIRNNNKSYSHTNNYTEHSISTNHRCYYCGKSEPCDKYFVVYADDVYIYQNGEVDIKDGKYIYLGSDCYGDYIYHNVDVFACEKAD